MASLTELLEEARKCLHLLLTGQQATVLVDQNGERIEYRAANAGRLAAYISDLERQLAGQPRPTAYRFQTSKGIL